jgi:hypothetical protein
VTRDDDAGGKSSAGLGWPTDHGDPQLHLTPGQQAGPGTGLGWPTASDGLRPQEREERQ